MTPEETEALGIQLTCAQVIEFLAEYLNHGLPSDQRIIFEAHLAICQECRDYLASYQATIRLAQKTNATAEVPSIPEELIQAILAAQARTKL
jgi:predicted anti-sigma-YlaC factor YlaD